MVGKLIFIAYIGLIAGYPHDATELNWVRCTLASDGEVVTRSGGVTLTVTLTGDLKGIYVGSSAGGNVFESGSVYQARGGDGPLENRPVLQKRHFRGYCGFSSVPYTVDLKSSKPAVYRCTAELGDWAGRTYLKIGGDTGFIVEPPCTVLVSVFHRVRDSYYGFNRYRRMDDEELPSRWVGEMSSNEVRLYVR